MKCRGKRKRKTLSKKNEGNDLPKIIGGKGYRWGKGQGWYKGGVQESIQKRHR